MAFKRYILVLAATLLVSFALPLSTTASRTVLESGVRVITLSAAGSDIANSVAFSPAGNHLAVGASSGIFIFNSQTLSQEQFIDTNSWARSVAFSPDGQTIAAGLFDGTARFWRLTDGQEIRTFVGHSGWVRNVAFSPDGRLFATVADDDTVRLWTTDGGLPKLTVPDLTGARVLALSPDGKLLAVGLQDASIRLLSLPDGNPVRTLTGHGAWVRSLAFSPDGQTLASGAFDAKAILWDVNSGQIKHTLSDHQSSVLGLSFSPDGRTLASGSVDSTIKLWDAEDGSLDRTLVGHIDFVYSVAFSPDGKTVASGSSDNSVRLWELSDASAGNFLQPATPSDCRLCHHPRGANAQPRVIQVSCEACHANGIGMNFCPFFARAPQATSLPLSSAEKGLPVGIPVARRNLSVVLSYPTNGETIYTASPTFAPLFVTGKVDYTGKAEQVLVQLSVYSAEADEPVLTLETHPSNQGRFTFPLTVNPRGALPASLKPGGADCQACHEDFHSRGNLSDGVVRLLVRAVSPENETASDERWLKVDTSGSAQIEVHVIDKDSQKPVGGLPVSASAILYEWRARYARQETDPQGLARLTLEALTQALTVYQITVPDTVLNGYFYSAVEPISVTLIPGETGYEPITIQVEVKTGQVSGRLSGFPLTQPLDVLAIHLPDGSLTKSESINDTFEFHDLPSGEYLFALDPLSTAYSGVQSRPALVDLRQSPAASIELELTSLTGTTLSGQLRDENGDFLPFGWISITTATGQTVMPDPVTGTFTLSTTESANQSLTALAPGYYSQAQLVDFSNDSPVDFTLVRQPGTASLPWGEGEIVLPADSVYATSSDGIHLTSGWVWGQGGDGVPASLQVAGMQVELSGGTFAIQYQPLEGGWLYLPKGEAVIREAGRLEVRVRGGEMVALLEGRDVHPVPYHPAVVSILNSATEAPVSVVWEPSLIAQVQNRLAQIGIGAAQIITFVTYFIVLVILVAITGRGIYWLWKENKIA